MNKNNKVTKDDHSIGNNDAPVTLVEYADFECPYCRRIYPTIEEILKIKGDKIRFVFRNFPLSESHPHALRAACATEAASKQGKFWEMYKMIFENQLTLEDQILIADAKNLNLNIDQFIKDMESKEIIKKVNDSFMCGIKSGVNGTPAFFINETLYDGPHELESLLEAIDSASKI